MEKINTSNSQPGPFNSLKGGQGAPSIFNDVLGPVMRGPSSSHCAASLRIGRICRDLMNGEIKDVLIEYDPNGSLATTHKSQGSDMGLFGGFLGWEADDERLPDYLQAIETVGIKIDIKIVNIDADHPNTYKITLFNEDEMHTITALSTGGGMIEIVEIDGAQLSVAGDYFETFVYCEKPERIAQFLNSSVTVDEVNICKGRLHFVEIKSQHFLSDNIEEELLGISGVNSIKRIHPVLPVMSRKNLSVPFSTCNEMLQYNEGKELALWQLALKYESERGNISEAEVYEKMERIVQIMHDSIRSGLKGTKYKDRILGAQSLNFQKKMEAHALVGNDVLNTIILYVSAIMEVKSSMGVIVAAPTAGSCGALPGAVLGTIDALGLPRDTAVKAMLAAGMIGVYIAAYATFAAEVGGCQAECGSGSGMAAAAIVEIAGGNLHQALAASSMALQNSLGMICDPIANRVEAPCLGRNVMAGSNALSCANMALSDYDHLIPLDEVIEAMDKVGKSIDHELRCTGLGGVAISKTAKEIEARLNGGELVEENLRDASKRFKIC